MELSVHRDQGSHKECDIWGKLQKSVQGSFEYSVSQYSIEYWQVQVFKETVQVLGEKKISELEGLEPVPKNKNGNLMLHGIRKVHGWILC